MHCLLHNFRTGDRPKTPAQNRSDSSTPATLLAGLPVIGSMLSKGSQSASNVDAEPTACLLRVEKIMCPSVSPPYPLNLALKGQAASQVQDMIRGLSAAAQRRMAAAAAVAAAASN
jgi:hypothetical protein